MNILSTPFPPFGHPFPVKGQGDSINPCVVILVSGTPFPITGEGLGIGVVYPIFPQFECENTKKK